MIRNIIFDWSGTLVDDLPAVWKATNYVLARARSAEMTLDEFRARFCLPFTIFYDRHAPNIPLSRLEEWYHRKFKLVQDSVRELPHARAFLEFCRTRGLRRFLLSTIHPNHFAVQSAITGFGAFLEKSYVEVHDKRKKIREILSENGLKPGETLFVGDMQHDIETARHGGIHSCAVLTGYNTLSQLRAAKPDLIVEHLGELKAILERGGLRPAGRTRDGAGTLNGAGKRAVRTALRVAEAEFPVATVGALIFNRAGKVLMVRTHKWSDLWGIPGGKIKWGESSVRALRREIREETNLELSDIRFVLVQDCIRSKEFYREAHFILLNYTARCRSPARVKLNQEARLFRWVELGEALEMPVNRPTRRLLEAVAAEEANQKRRR